MTENRLPPRMWFWIRVTRRRKALADWHFSESVLAQPA